MNEKNTTTTPTTVLPKVEKPTRKKVKKTPEFRCARATNAVIRSVGVIMRRGAPLSENQKKAIVVALKAAVADAEKALSAPKGEKAPKFALPTE